MLKTLVAMATIALEFMPPVPSCCSILRGYQLKVRLATQGEVSNSNLTVSTSRPLKGPRDSDLIKAVKKLKRVFTEEEASSSTEDNSLRSPSAILTRLIEKICVESVCHK